MYIHADMLSIIIGACVLLLAFICTHIIGLYNEIRRLNGRLVDKDLTIQRVTDDCNNNYRMKCGLADVLFKVKVDDMSPEAMKQLVIVASNHWPEGEDDDE